MRGVCSRSSGINRQSKSCKDEAQNHEICEVTVSVGLKGKAVFYKKTTDDDPWKVVTYGPCMIDVSVPALAPPPFITYA